MGIFFNLFQFVLLSSFNTAQSQKWLDPCVALDWCNDNGDCAALSSSEAKCLCKKGFVGKTCSEKGDESHWWHEKRSKEPPGKDLCEELNWCSGNGGCWEKSPTETKCLCKKGYTGKTCSEKGEENSSKGHKSHNRRSNARRSDSSKSSENSPKSSKAAKESSRKSVDRKRYTPTRTYEQYQESKARQHRDSKVPENSSTPSKAAKESSRKSVDRKRYTQTRTYKQYQESLKRKGRQHKSSESDADPCKSLNFCNGNGNCKKISATEAKCSCGYPYTGKDCKEKLEIRRHKKHQTRHSNDSQKRASKNPDSIKKRVSRKRYLKKHKNKVPES